ncbi:MAG: DUF4159 domain-containing protein [Polyangiaceae bacterium]
MVRYEDGEQAELALESGVFRVGSASALPAAARTPAEALAGLRQALARRSYMALVRVLSAETRGAVESDLSSIVDGLQDPDTLEVQVSGDDAEVELPSGHSVRLKREAGVWRVEDSEVTLSRRAWIHAGGALAAGLLAPASAAAFGESTAFNPRLLRAGNRLPPAWCESAVARWAWELLRRTSAPARLVASHTTADRAELWSEPFAIWCGDAEVGALSNAELRGMARFFRLGGVLLVDDVAPVAGAFARSARREIARVLPESPPVRLDPTHVLFKTFYLLDKPVGRALGSEHLDAIVRGKNAQVIFSESRPARRAGSQWRRLGFRGRAGREHAARTRSSAVREYRDVPFVLGLQGRPGARRVADASPSRSASLMSTYLAIADDLHGPTLLLVAVVLCSWLLLLLWEVRRLRLRRGALLASGVLAFALLALAALRPVRVKSRASRVGPRVVLLADCSRRLLLPADDAQRTRDAVLRESLPKLAQALSGARLSVLGFGEAEPFGWAPSDDKAPRARDSDLSLALESLARGAGERPEAAVLLSDGRLLSPAESASARELEQLAAKLSIPLHVVRLAERALPDAALRSVHNAGVAVAHQPLALRLEVACSGGLQCDQIPVRVRELKQGEAPLLLAEGVAKFEGKDSATLELGVTLERAGTRIVEVEIKPPDGDRVADNDRRLLPFNVARERVRLLHVAGRPTYDVRSLRMWLKANDSVDLVAFFILRTDQSDTNTVDQSEELSLIPFPVNDLFTEHLPSFDAVVLQDIDAVTYKLAQYLPALERYVRSGGGIIMVGGPSSFAGGGYARSSLERVLPIEIGDPTRPFDVAEFVPAYTDAGRVAPVLAPLRELVSADLPKMVGANLLGKPKDSAIVLWERPALRAGERALPILALNDAGDGRTIALGVDGTHQLAFSEFAERTAGRAYGALWDGLLGWLMRDPRYEAARIELVGECIAGDSARLKLTRLPGAEGDVEMQVEALSADSKPSFSKRAHVPTAGVVEIDVGPLAVGGYTARARVGQAPATRFDFACERGGEAFRDSRPNPELLTRIARASGGRSVDAAHAGDIPLPAPTEVSVEREVSPLLPAWAWALGAALALGAHWIARRRSGLS